MPRDFWPRTLARRSLRQPAELGAPFAAPLLSPRELFALLVAAADSIREGTPRDLRLYLGDQKMVWRQTGEQLGAAYGQLLPRRSDRTLAGYGERLRARHSTPCFAIMLNDCQTLSPIVWERVRDFAAGLVEGTGFPLGGVDANIFAGNYRRTPFGVHTDDRDVFTWIVEGPKRFLVWPWRQLAPLFGPEAKRPRQPHDYADQRRRAQRLAGRAGELLYWPREYWHVAEAGAGELSATLSIGIDPRLPAGAWAKELLGNLAALAVGAPASATGASPAGAHRRHPAEELPPDLSRVIAAASEGALAERFERELRLRWMCWRTALGLRTPPRDPPCELRPEDHLYARPHAAVARVAWRGYLLCAVNGYGLAVPTWKGSDRLFDRLFDLLSSGESFRVRDLYSSLSRSAEPQQLTSLLSALISCRALSFVELRAARRAPRLPDPVFLKPTNDGPRRRKALTGPRKK